MSDNIFDKIKPPDRFVGLHAHSHFSTYDGLGYPQDHIDFVLQNEMDAWALTDHGNGNGLAHARAHTNILAAKGQKYRQLYGVEFYFVPSLEDWKNEYGAHRQAIKDAKNAKDQEKLATKNIVVDAEDEVEQGGHIIEDEDQTKRDRGDKPEWKRYYHLVIVAKDRIGLQNLFTLVKKSYKHGFYRFPRIDYKLLKEHAEGLIVSTACVGGLASGLIYRQFSNLRFDELTPDLMDDPAVNSTIMNRLENMTDRFVDCVGEDNFFLEVQFNDLPAQHLTNHCLLKLNEKTGIPLIATADSHYPSPDMWQARELYKKLGWMGTKIDEQVLPKKEDIKCILYPKNATQMWEEFKKNHSQYEFYHGKEEQIRDAIERTHDITWQKCEDVWIEPTGKLPNFSNSESTAFQQLLNLVKKGLAENDFVDKPEYVERAFSELSDIKHLGFENYFLTLHRVFEEACYLPNKVGTLPGAGRGSGAGSLVNYLLKITHVDPLKYDLLWERFLGRHRSGWPDIDTDVGDRDVLINSARKIFGEDAVVPVSNFNTLKLKSLIKDVSKFYGIDFGEVNAVTGPLEADVMNKARDPNMEKSMFILRHEDCIKYSPKYKAFMEKYPYVEEKVISLFMQNRSIGRHAGGVLICPELEKHMPVISVRGELQTPWSEGVNIRNLEENGFLKFDFLGLKQMKMVEDCIRLILTKKLSRKPSFAEIRKFYDENLNCRFHEPDDARVFKYAYQDGRWPGIFQFTSTGARRFCMKAKPKNITELAAITAIYRPGPLKAHVDKKYVKARSNPVEIQYSHPVLEDVLGSTYGFIVFQEQFMLLAQKLAGFTPGESDKMRKTLVKKDLTSLGKKSSEREDLRRHFVAGAIKNANMDRRDAEGLFEKIAFFSLYGFNKSHAVAYAIVSYYGAWLMTHYEKEWLATVLQSELSNPKGLTTAIAEIKQSGHNFSAVDINYSGPTWTFSNEINAFVPPLGSIKGAGAAAVGEILQNRPYNRLDDLFFDDDGKWKHSKFNKSCLTSLCKIEAFGSLFEMQQGIVRNHNQLLQIMTDDKNYETLKKGRFGITQTAYKRALKKGESLPPVLDRLIDQYQAIDDWPRNEKIHNQFEIMSTVENDLLFPPNLIQRINEKDVSSALQINSGARGIGWFCITQVLKKKSKNNKTFYRLKIVDNNSNFTWLRVWGEMYIEPVPYTLWLADIKNDADWGMSTGSSKIKLLNF